MISIRPSLKHTFINITIYLVVGSIFYTILQYLESDFIDFLDVVIVMFFGLFLLISALLDNIIFEFNGNQFRFKKLKSTHFSQWHDINEINQITFGFIRSFILLDNDITIHIDSCFYSKTDYNQLKNYFKKN